MGCCEPEPPESTLSASCPCGYRRGARMVTGCGARSCALSVTTLVTTSLSTP